MKQPQKVYQIDTNIILRYLLDDHKVHSPKAKAFMAELFTGTKKAEIPDVVIVECIYTLDKYYKIPRSEISAKLSGILNFSGIVNFDRSELLEALLKYDSTSIDIADCILAAHSSPEKVVISFDNDMKKLKAVCETL
ncbi:MAG: PIN domain-containing protein [Deltaproteobacteria bacterium]|nr:PIN domain-containing protein [Deltaproteobacteria bacterium]